VNVLQVVEFVVSERGPSPRDRILKECGRIGDEAAVRHCVDILEGRDVNADFLVVLGGEPAKLVLGGAEGGLNGYWPRVWALRGLLHVWNDQATNALLDATSDESWRAREMATKVVSRHRVDAALGDMLRLRSDPNHRVCAGAERALVALSSEGS
jgi:hypothetical protein